MGCGSQHVQGQLHQRPQGNIIITINFIMFGFILLLVLAFLGGILFLSLFVCWCFRFFFFSLLGISVIYDVFLFFILIFYAFLFLLCFSVVL